MCHFVGIASNDGKMFRNEQMEKVIKHASNGNKNIFNNDFVCLIGKNDTDKQGTTNMNERYEIVFQGELYNASHLKSMLIKKGAKFISDTDEEILLTAFYHFGKNCVHHLNGKFAFLIWDKREKILFGARDHFGIKPLFYRQIQRDTFLFSTRKQLLLHAKENNFIDGESLYHYLTFQYVPDPHTAVMHIKKLEAGHFFYWKPGKKLTTEPYWKPQFSQKESLKKTISRFLFYPFIKNQLEEEKNDILSNILGTLRQSVKAHMQGDKSIGAFLSGGIDSTAIVALAKEFKPKLKTFTAEFAVEGYSEGDIAEKTAEILDVDHNRVVITPEDIMKEFSNIVSFSDEPVADPAAIPLYFIAKEASKHVEAVLSGEGADELFGGYGIYREPQALLPFKLIPRVMKPYVKQLAQLLPAGIKGRGYILRGATPIEDRFIGNAKIFEGKEKGDILIPNLSHWKTSTITYPLYMEAEKYDEVTKMQYVDIHTWLRGDILVKANTMTMAHQLELRAPFLNKDLFEVAARLPKRGKIKGKDTKVWLREALAGVVPEHVIYRKKLGFPVPIRHWLKDDMYEWARNWIIESDIDHLFYKKACLKLLEDHRNNKVDASRKIWTILTYIVWNEQFIENCERKNNRLIQVI